MASAPVRHQVPHVLHRTMEFMRVERGLFVIAAGMGFLVWNLSALFDLRGGLPAGFVCFLMLYTAAYYSTKREPQLLKLLLTTIRARGMLHGWRVRTTFDPHKHEPVRLKVIRHD